MNEKNLSSSLYTDNRYMVNIDDLSFDFAKKVVISMKHLMSSVENKEYIISKQLIRSGTSIAANIAEANFPQSDADYVNKMSIALKEANESRLWIRLLRECEYLSNEEYESLFNDCERIIKIVFTIIQKVKKRINKK